MHSAHVQDEPIGRLQSGTGVKMPPSAISRALP